MSDLEQKWNDEYKNFMLRFYPESTPFIYTWEIYKTAKRESHVKIRELLELVEILNQIRDNLQDSTKELQERIASQQKIIEELKRGLEFYADHSNWMNTYKMYEPEFRKIIKIDVDLKPNRTGGKVAREALLKIEELEKERNE